jgi:hypothetical protein
MKREGEKRGYIEGAGKIVLAHLREFPLYQAREA